MELRSVQVPMLRGLAICPTCGHPSDEVFFAESGLDGNFRTWVHTETGAVYRQDLDASTSTQAEEFKLICEHAGGTNNVQESPGTPLCKICGVRFEPKRIDALGETRRSVFVVYSGSAA
jgi:hypothetical protein